MNNKTAQDSANFAIPLFKFFKEFYLSNDKNLEDLCKRILEKYEKNVLIKKYSVLANFNKVLINKLNDNKIVSYFKFKNWIRIKKAKNISMNRNISRPRKEIFPTATDENVEIKNHSYKNLNNSFSHFTKGKRKSIIGKKHPLDGENINVNVNVIKTECSFKDDTNDFITTKNILLTQQDGPLYNKLSSIEKQDLLNLSECTFRPKIVNKSFDLDNKEDVCMKLYNEHKSRSLKKHQKVIERLRNESKECTFKPSYTSKLLNRSKSFSHFLNNMEKDKVIRKEKLFRMMIKNQTNSDNLYSFTPKVYKTNSLNNSLSGIKSLRGETPRYISLYEDNKLRLERQKNRSINFYNDLLNSSKGKQMCRSKSSDNLNIEQNYSNYYDKLYEDNIRIKSKKLSLINNFYKDITFRPKIKENIKIVTTFRERNEKMIELKNEILNKNKENNGNKGKKIMSKEEIESNNRNVVERLYNKEIEKIKEKKQKEKQNIEKNLEKEKKGNKNLIIEKMKQEHNIKFKNEFKMIKGIEIYNSFVENCENISTIKISNEEIKTERENENFNTQHIQDIKIKSIDQDNFTSLISSQNDLSSSQNNFKSRALMNILKDRKDVVTLTSHTNTNS